MSQQNMFGSPMSQQNMVGSAEGGMYVPRRVSSIPKVIGILNIIFGIVMFLYGMLTLVSLLVAPMLQQSMTKTMERVEKKSVESQEKRIADIEEQLEKALPEDKEALQDEMDDLQEQIDEGSFSPTEIITDAQNASDAIKIPSIINESVMALMNIMLIISGIGLVRYEYWGKKSALWTASFKIFVSVCWLVYALVVMMPIQVEMSKKLFETMDKVGPGPAGPNPASAFLGGPFFLIVFIISAVVGFLFSAIYPLLCIIFLTRPVVNQTLDTYKIMREQENPSPFASS